MRYRIHWLPSAESELAEIWLASSDRKRITTAAAELDRRLAANAPDEGESRSNELRITFELPLAIVFRVLADVNLVEVGQVWLVE